jgi:hypothetical protein
VGLCAEALLGEIDRILGAFTERLRTDALAPAAAPLSEAELEDHVSTFLSEIAQSLVILGAGGSPSLMQDGSDIQRLISERHGAQRARHDWTETALRREFALLREVVEEAAQKISTGLDADVAGAQEILMRLIARAEQISTRGFRLALAVRTT